MPAPQQPKLAPVENARRYLANAREILSEKGCKEDGYYYDEKYVKMAGHTAYSGVLVALDGYFGKKKGRKDADWYVENLAKTDRKVMIAFNVAYEALHLVMGYDGSGDADMIAIGFNRAQTIIDWVETRTAA